MIRYYVKTEKVEKVYDHPLFGRGKFVKEVKSRPVLQWQDAEGVWHDVETVEDSNDGA